MLIKKAEELKCINKVSITEKNMEIFNILFNTRIINLENIAIELQQKEKIQMLIYDGNTMEKQVSLKINRDDLIVKLDKKVKLFS